MKYGNDNLFSFLQALVCHYWLFQHFVGRHHLLLPHHFFFGIDHLGSYTNLVEFTQI